MVKIQLYNEDCQIAIKKIKEESIDLIVTSPPYNVDLGNNKYNKNPYDIYNDNKEHLQYLKWLKRIFSQLYLKLKVGGRVCINIGDGKNGQVPTHSDITQFMSKELKYIPMTTIIWNKGQTSNRSAWGSYLKPSCPSFPRGFEYILIFAKKNKKLQYIGETDIQKSEFIDWSNGLWNIKPEINMKRIGHPAVFPEEIPKRLIKMLSWKNATVLDPFMGAGTTGVVCKKLNRNFIGIEISEEYWKIAQKRINKIEGDIFEKNKSM
jgi:site-specific DNA-methyltransferase (adenine-specific)